MQVYQANYQSPGQAGQRGLEDLDCSQLALDMAVNAHELANHLLPEEKYDFSVQIRSSAKSVTANIAEGNGLYPYLDSLRPYSMARVELQETLVHFANALVLAYIELEYYNEIHDLIHKTDPPLNGFMNYIRKQRAGAAEFGSRQTCEEFELHATTQD